MQIEHNPKQLSDLIERHRTFMLEGRTLKTPVRIGPHAVYASIGRKEIRLSYGMEFELEMDIETSNQKGIEIHGYLFEKMRDINSRPPFVNIPLTEMPHLQMYGRDFVIQTLFHTDFSNDKSTKLRLGCVYVAHVADLNEVRRAERVPEWQYPFNLKL